MVYEIIGLEAQINNQHICLKNNSAQFNTGGLRWNFSCVLRDAPDVHWFPTVHVVKNLFLLKNLSISEP